MDLELLSASPIGDDVFDAFADLKVFIGTGRRVMLVPMARRIDMR